MPIYFYWGEDDFTLNQAVHHLRDRVLDLPLVSFSLKKQKIKRLYLFLQIYFCQIYVQNQLQMRSPLLNPKSSRVQE